MPAEYESPTDAQFLIQLRSAGSGASRRSKRFVEVIVEGKQSDIVASEAKSAIEETPMIDSQTCWSAGNLIYEIRRGLLTTTDTGRCLFLLLSEPVTVPQDKGILHPFGHLGIEYEVKMCCWF